MCSGPNPRVSPRVMTNVASHQDLLFTLQTFVRPIGNIFLYMFLFVENHASLNVIVYSKHPNCDQFLFMLSVQMMPFQGGFAIVFFFLQGTRAKLGEAPPKENQ